MRERSGQRRISGASVVWVVLGTLAMLALLIIRRQAPVEALKTSYKKARDRLEQVREQPTEMEARKRRVMNFIEKTARTSSESEQDVLRYLKDLQYPATKDELVSAARSNDAPEELLVELVGLTIREYSSPREV